MLIKLFNFFLVFSIMSIILCSKWFFIWFWIECISLSVMILLRKQKKSVRNLESMSKYFVTQALASVIILVGVLSRYFELGAVSMNGEYGYMSYAFIVSGLLVKLGVLPNPYWFMDVISGVSFSRLGYVLMASKMAPLYLSFLVINLKIFIISGFMGALTALIFSMLGINQANFRKLMAFSSVANLGWFVLCLPLMKGFNMSFCFIGYVLTMMPLVWVSQKVSFSKLLKSNRFYYNSSYKMMLVFSLLSLGGLPPFMGFFVKWTFFQNLIKNGLYLFSALLIMSSLFSLYFYLFSSFKLYSLFSKNTKSQKMFLYCVKTKAFLYYVGVSTTSFLSLLFILGFFWVLSVS